MRFPVAFALIVSCLAAVVSTGCTLGYRYHHLDSEIANAAGANAQVEGSGHMVELGIVLDFRYFRVGNPYVGASYEMDVTDAAGGGAYQSSTIETQPFRLDVPVVSLWSEDGGLGYPGTMVHRKSVELWLSGTLRPTTLPMWWADASLVYYHHDLVAVRAFGGWGAVPFEGQTTQFSTEGTTYEFWETTAGGYSAGVELTLGAGEQALDFIKYFIRNQKEAGKPRK
ncbi:hypothetical protein FIV42_21825 [Persicimonas caeni]|uniref:Lipoprotein n=1 Tax=Persicimonas caeni TaxID=2292766 RepID=A0A4Y6PY94_PERCE|nr:hypothetical protein [Persicimonas caeni]QDG53286.1 hypothetical protein FIV42_21825 [Persicimonas caeni]QED34508.1 hypothetical protein FRD00_21820 [Persicimonas caeni]